MAAPATSRTYPARPSPYPAPCLSPAISSPSASVSAASPPASRAPPPSNGPVRSSSISAPGQPYPAIKPLAAAPSPLTVEIPPTPAVPTPPINKMSMAAVVSPMPASPVKRTPISVTSKEWVVPPRPKPGRKPALDSPPTKRKAQNRAAQRAFRERRAARVGELETQLEEQKAKHEQVEQGLQDKIQGLESDVRGLETEVQVLRSRCQMLESLLDKTRLARGSMDGNSEGTRRWNVDVNRSLAAQGGAQPVVSTPHQQHGGHVTLGPGQQTQLRSAQSRGSTSSVSTAASRRQSAQSFSIAQIISPPDEVSDPAAAFTCGSCKPDESCVCAQEALAATAALDCGKCTLGSKCACMEATIRALDGGALPGELKRPHPPGSPTPFGPEKKLRPDPGAEAELANGISQRKRDSTGSVIVSARYSSPNPFAPPPPTDLIQPPEHAGATPPKDPCGFCEEGTYCVCAEAALADTNHMTTAPQQPQSPPMTEPESAPTPMEVTATGAIKLPSLQSLRDRKRSTGAGAHAVASAAAQVVTIARPSCGPNGPGTCAQCLADPKSGLFCRSLAANFDRQSPGNEGGGCCGGGGPGGCCRSKNKGDGGGNLPAREATAARDMGISLSCADAYKTLASHRHFSEAADEIGTWLPMLKAAPRPGAAGTAQVAPARHPMEVEAASIMSVLKVFDVRFGN